MFTNLKAARDQTKPSCTYRLPPGQLGTGTSSSCITIIHQQYIKWAQFSVILVQLNLLGGTNQQSKLPTHSGEKTENHDIVCRYIFKSFNKMDLGDTLHSIIQDNLQLLIIKKKVYIHNCRARSCTITSATPSVTRIMFDTRQLHCNLICLCSNYQNNYF